MMMRRIAAALVGLAAKAVLTLDLKDGTRLTARHNSGVPTSNIADQGRRLDDKFTALVEPILGRSKAGDLLGEINRLDTLKDVRGLMALCAA